VCVHAHTRSPLVLLCFVFKGGCQGTHGGVCPPLPLTFHPLMSSPVFLHSFPCWRGLKEIGRFCSGLSGGMHFPGCLLARWQLCQEDVGGGNGSGHEILQARVLEWGAIAFSIHVSILFQIIFLFWLLQSIEESSVCYTVGPCWWGEHCPPQIHVHPEPQNVTLFGNHLSADVIS